MNGSDYEIRADEQHAHYTSGGDFVLLKEYNMNTRWALFLPQSFVDFYRARWLRQKPS
jgi:hypothetical protein